MTPLLLILAGGLLPGVDAKEDAKKIMDQVQGSWTTTSLVFNGRDVSNEDYARLRFVFKGEEAVIEGSDQVKKEYARIGFKFDPSATPHLVDMTVKAGSQKDVVIEGIFEIKGDELKICARVIGNERPTDFTSADNSNVALIVLKREKP
jgi:uncharacterized protein (TIGR03067 family)